MIKTLTKHGNSLATVKNARRSEAFRSALEKVNARYPKALKKLAE